MGLLLHLFFIYISCMQKEKVLQLIDEKLAQIEEAEKKNAVKGNLNFGLHLHLYRQSPYLADFEKKRKRLRNFLWFETFFIPLMLVGISSDLWDKFFDSPFIVVAGVLVISAVSGLLFVYFPLYALIANANSVQKDVKKLMLHDLRQKVEALDEFSEKAVQKTGVGSF